MSARRDAAEAESMIKQRRLQDKLTSASPCDAAGMECTCKAKMEARTTEEMNFMVMIIRVVQGQ